MPDGALGVYFRLFNEIGILAQLTRAMFETRLPPGFVMAQFAVLNHLIRVKDGQTPLALARAFQVPKTSMTHSLSVLEAAGLVELRPNPDDGRSKLVFLTEAGRRFREEAIAALAPDVARIAQAIPAGRAEALIPTLEALRRFLDEDRDRRG